MHLCGALGDQLSQTGCIRGHIPAVGCQSLLINRNLVQTGLYSPRAVAWFGSLPKVSWSSSIKFCTLVTHLARAYDAEHIAWLLRGYQAATPTSTCTQSPLVAAFRLVSGLSDLVAQNRSPSPVPGTYATSPAAAIGGGQSLVEAPYVPYGRKQWKGTSPLWWGVSCSHFHPCLGFLSPEVALSDEIQPQGITTRIKSTFTRAWGRAAEASPLGLCNHHDGANANYVTSHVAHPRIHLSRRLARRREC